MMGGKKAEEAPPAPERKKVTKIYPKGYSALKRKVATRKIAEAVMKHVAAKRTESSETKALRKIFRVLEKHFDVSTKKLRAMGVEVSEWRKTGYGSEDGHYISVPASSLNKFMDWSSVSAALGDFHKKGLEVWNNYNYRAGKHGGSDLSIYDSGIHLNLGASSDISEPETGDVAYALIYALKQVVP